MYNTKTKAIYFSFGNNIYLFSSVVVDAANGRNIIILYRLKVFEYRTIKFHISVHIRILTNVSEQWYAFENFNGHPIRFQIDTTNRILFAHGCTGKREHRYILKGNVYKSIT